ncbi:threonine--tRNA ligase [Calorimonas adulescens]|jgi:threonyl-tRNA synthetase (EC 6.1.1.3)/Ser-tRNA(Thr) hydrolase (EC 3.1.1.-)|uniref:Threonine--tRNA ligase n=1 Tax=Calorimonas adulescens TaxID=2606906 RepID=A0A5D8QDU1_9THEO|nr:threonine--tRNA ligase [Calorimonas adulescens]TZE82785.1 threonine--tRNA ligase [Calorimonas adulescens]
MVKVTLPDESIIEVEEGTRVIDVAKMIGSSLAKNALGGMEDNRVVGLRHPLNKDCRLRILTFEDEDGRRILRHTASHVMAQAVKRLFPGAKLAIGPAIETGFYYDFDIDRPFTPEDFAAIEAEMKKIVEADYPVIREVKTKEEALQFMREKDEPYKVELIEALPDDATITFYTQGEFTDLCAGPHLPSTGMVRAFKLLSVAGAYWRGDEHNKMLQRIYGTAFVRQKDLDDYLNMLEEAKKRDHRKLGKELDLFSIQEEGPGFPFFHPKGMILRNELEDFWKAEHIKRGYQEIKTPIILNEELWHRSGHWDHYKDNMYFTTIDEATYAIKPMNCPGAILVYNTHLHSYRELPIRLAELGLVHRHELSGVLHGLMRVRCFTQDDAHIFMTPEQVRDEILGVIDLADYVYNLFGFDYHVELSTRPENSMGTDEQWNMATDALRDALEAKGINYKVNEGDGAFYGPKIDFHLKDSIGRTWQCGTIQLDFQMPERFDLVYIGPDGEKHRPVMVHRTILGSIERFIGILTEQFAGAFPVWLSPVQVRVIPITDRHKDYAACVLNRIRETGIRADMDDRNEKVGYKIREGEMQKIPYMLIAGDKEVEASGVSVRERKGGDMGCMSLDAFIDMVKEKINTKAID